MSLGVGHDSEELLALAASRPNSRTIIRERPREMADLLRAAKGLTAEDMARFARQAQEGKRENGATR